MTNDELRAAAELPAEDLTIRQVMNMRSKAIALLDELGELSAAARAVALRAELATNPLLKAATLRLRQSMGLPTGDEAVKALVAAQDVLAATDALDDMALQLAEARDTIAMMLAQDVTEDVVHAEELLEMRREIDALNTRIVEDYVPRSACAAMRAELDGLKRKFAAYAQNEAHRIAEDVATNLDRVRAFEREAMAKKMDTMQAIAVSQEHAEAFAEAAGAIRGVDGSALKGETSPEHKEA